jgi:hypothetical protein
MFSIKKQLIQLLECYLDAKYLIIYTCLYGDENVQEIHQTSNLPNAHTQFQILNFFGVFWI